MSSWVEFLEWPHRPSRTQFNSAGHFIDHSTWCTVVTELASWVELSWVGQCDHGLMYVTANNLVFIDCCRYLSISICRPEHWSSYISFKKPFVGREYVLKCNCIYCRYNRTWEELISVHVNIMWKIVCVIVRVTSGQVFLLVTFELCPVSLNWRDIQLFSTASLCIRQCRQNRVLWNCEMLSALNVVR